MTSLRAARVQVTRTVGLLVAAGLVTAACSAADSGTAVPESPRSATAGLLIAHPLTDGSVDDDTILLLDASGEQVSSIDSGGASAPARVLGGGRVLLDGNSSPVVLDTGTRTLTPISWDGEADFGPMDTPPSITVAKAGDWLLLGNSEMSQLGLVNLRTGEETDLDVDVRQLLATEDDRHFSLDLAAPGPATELDGGR